MYVTDAAVGSLTMSPETARDGMVRQRDASKDQNALEQLRTVAGLCNSGELDAATSHLPLSERKIHGDATDQAILRLSEYLGPVSELKKLWTKTFELAFNSKNKFMIRTLSLTDKAGLSLALSADEASSFQEDST
jgi:sodium/potassium-transporting ATPase subunit alpha